MTIPKYLLYQVRNPGDPMRGHEIRCFATRLQCPESNILVHDLISERPPKGLLAQVDAVLVGGSGDYSVVEGGDWLSKAMDELRDLYESGKPTFASCRGFRCLPKRLAVSSSRTCNERNLVTSKPERCDGCLRPVAADLQYPSPAACRQ